MNRSDEPLLLPPFRFVEGQSPREAAEHIVSAFMSIEGLPGKAGWTLLHTSSDLGEDRDASLDRAATALADAIDANAAFFDRLPYHNRQHFCEVMLVVCFLCRAQRIGTKDAQLVLLAALVHDLVYDAEPGPPFRLERASFRLAHPHLLRAGVSAEDCGRLAALVLATEPTQGVTFALRARYLRAAGSLPAEIARHAPELAQLERQASLVTLAQILCEADLLPSVGLTFDHGVRVQERLSAEWGRSLCLADKLRFVERVIAQGIVGPWFAPNLLDFRQSLRAQVDEPR